MPDQRFHSNGSFHSAVRLPVGKRVYAIGDIHGRQDLLERLHASIQSEIRATEGIDATVVYLGDYIDRGTCSAGVIETLSEKPLEGADSVHLMGNHEEFMLAFAETGARAETWIFNGGLETLASYSLDRRAVTTEWSPAEAAARFRDAVPQRHWTFLRDLKTHFRIGGLFFAHAGVDPDRPLDRQRTEDLLWIREPFLFSEKKLDALVVHGHTPMPHPEITPNRINVDTGAWQTGVLSAAVFEDGRVRFIST